MGRGKVGILPVGAGEGLGGEAGDEAGGKLGPGARVGSEVDFFLGVGTGAGIDWTCPMEFAVLGVAVLELATGFSWMEKDWKAVERSSELDSTGLMAGSNGSGWKALLRPKQPHMLETPQLGVYAGRKRVHRAC